MRVVVLGASGFVGAALWELLQARPGVTAVPVVHLAGNAGRITRYPAKVATADVMEPGSIAAVVKGADAVVNCTMGPNDVLEKGIGNVVRAVRGAGVGFYVHLSSIRVYGQEPGDAYRAEVVTPQRPTDNYGSAKWQQERTVRRGLEGKVPFVILRPSNIDGPFSSFSQYVAERIQRGPFRLVQRGTNPCNVVHVYTLVHAIGRLLEQGPVDGVFHVNEAEALTWSDYFDIYRTNLDPVAPVVDITSETARAALEKDVPGNIWQETLAVARSTAFRQHLLALPIAARVRDAVKDGIQALPGSFGPRLMERVRSPELILPNGGPSAGLGRFETMQIRPTFHSGQALLDRIGTPLRCSFQQKVELTCRWLRHVQSMPESSERNEDRPREHTAARSRVGAV